MTIVELEAKVVEIEDFYFKDKLNTRRIVLELQGEKAKEFNFKPGQFAMLAHENVRLPQNENLLKWGAFSICSLPKDLPKIEFIVRVKDTPGLTNYIGYKLKENDTMKIKGPFGHFLLNDQDKRRVFVATGTGIAPIMSFIRHMHYENKFVESVLFYGFFSESTFFFAEELKKIADESNGMFNIVAVASDEEPKSDFIKKGYVQQYIKEYRFAEDKDSYGCYLCGNPAMVDDVKKLLTEMGFKRIFTEKY